MVVSADYDINVFINCAFDDEFQPFFRAIVFAIYDCGYIARCAMEVDDGAQNRFDKISKIIGDCRFAVHDLSRTELDKENNLPRFNMPLELGMFYGAKFYGKPDQRRKNCLILDKDKHRFEIFISDIKGIDIKSHDGDPEEAINKVRNWLSNNSGFRVPGPITIKNHFHQFSDELPEICKNYGVDPKEIEFNEFVLFVEEWLKDNAATV